MESYANLHAFDTENAAMSRGYFGLHCCRCAQTVLASMTQLLAEVPLSTRKSPCVPFMS